MACAPPRAQATTPHLRTPAPTPRQASAALAPAENPSPPRKAPRKTAGGCSWLRHPPRATTPHPPRPVSPAPPHEERQWRGLLGAWPRADPIPHAPRPPRHRHPSPTTQHLWPGWVDACRVCHARPAPPASGRCSACATGVGGTSRVRDTARCPKAKDAMLQRPAARALQPRRPRKNHGACTQGAFASLPVSHRAPLRPPGVCLLARHLQVPRATALCTGTHPPRKEQRCLHLACHGKTPPGPENPKTRLRTP
jgi:hypothetical protein